MRALEWIGAPALVGMLALGAGEASDRPVTPGFFAPPAALVNAALAASPRSAQEAECTGEPPDRFYEFYFTRAIYNDYSRGFFSSRGGRRGAGGGSWATDFPKADCQFISVTKRLAGMDMYADSWAIHLDDTRIRSYPFLYALEVGRNGGWSLTDAELKGLQDYLAAGGFLVIDDFWGTEQWYNFEREMMRILPNAQIVELPLDHELFNIFYTIDEIIQVPNISNGEAISLGYPGAVTYQSDGYVPHVRGIFDADGRLMVVINWNTDLGDAWEWAEQPLYPVQFSTHAFEMGVNMILYAMTH
jgi:hypothetical protein